MRVNGPVITRAVGASSDTITVSVGAGETGYSDPWLLTDADQFALEYKVACTGTPNIKIQVQQRSDDSIDWYTPYRMADTVPSVTDKNQHGCLIGPLCVRQIRFVIVEQTASVTDSVVSLRLSVQRKYTV